MQLVSKKNFLIFLAAILVVALGYMASTLSKRPKNTATYNSEIKQVEQQSNSDDLNSIEKDLNDTDLDSMDKELQDIDKELDQTN